MVNVLRQEGSMKIAIADFRVEYSENCITLWNENKIIYQGNSWEDIKEEIKGTIEEIEEM